jgi:hypothetical protein
MTAIVATDAETVTDSIAAKDAMDGLTPDSCGSLFCSGCYICNRGYVAKNAINAVAVVSAATPAVAFAAVLCLLTAKGAIDAMEALAARLHWLLW